MITINSGEKLKKIRLEKGLSLEEVHKKTKIHFKILKSIEEDDLINLNPVYIKGFIKIYCKFLEVDPAEFIKDYKEPRQKVNLGPRSENKPKKVFVKKNLKPKLPKLNLKYFKIIGFLILIVLVLFLVINIFKFIGSKIKSLPKKAKQAKVVQVVAPVKKTEAVKQVKPQAPVQQQVPATSLIRLGLRAQENCFVTLKSDGHVLFQAILKKGRFESWTAKDKFELSVSNAGAVTLELNSKVMPSLGKRGRALKNIVITRDGMTIGR